MHTYIKNAKNVILNTQKFWVKSEVKSNFWESEIFQLIYTYALKLKVHLLRSYTIINK